MVTHSSILAWRIPGTEEPQGIQSIQQQSRTGLKQLSTHTSWLIQPSHQPNHKTGSNSEKQLTKDGQHNFIQIGDLEFRKPHFYLKYAKNDTISHSTHSLRFLSSLKNPAPCQQQASIFSSYGFVARHPILSQTQDWVAKHKRFTMARRRCSGLWTMYLEQMDQ